MFPGAPLKINGAPGNIQGNLRPLDVMTQVPGHQQDQCLGRSLSHGCYIVSGAYQHAGIWPATLQHEQTWQPGDQAK